MTYKYITDDNLEHVQNYMYTQFEGYSFLEAYYQSRKPFLGERSDHLPVLLQTALEKSSGEPSETATRLICLLTSFDQSQADWFVKRFEVSKRLFAKYDWETGKPVVQSGYHDIQPYILLSAVTEKAYAEFHSLKYLNCFLKLNDTLISLVPGMENHWLFVLKVLITQETAHIAELARRKNVAFKEE